jgi:hypothetical protein
MYFVFRDGKLYRRLRAVVPRLPEGKLPALPGELPDMQPTGSITFPPPSPKCALKSFLEMRGADGGPWNRICALPALWVGLALRPERTRCRLGSGQGLGHGRAREIALQERGAEASGSTPHDPGRRHSARHCGLRFGGDFAQFGPFRARPAQRCGRQRDRLPRNRSTRSSLPARSPRRERLLELVPWRMERRHHAGLRRELLMPNAERDQR